MIDFNKKINYQRYASKQRQASDEYSVLRFFESDRGRILNSAAIRRLQQKTQVFPLERNSVVRTRLTHSMEVQQVGRYIVKEIVNRLSLSGKLKTFGLDKSVMSVESLVEMACLMHDIGNPPFGHFGEAAINILRLNLTYSQIASILKYSKPAYWSNDIPDEFSYLMKKPGYYLSEESFVNELSQQLDIQPFHRYPLTYIMEAADDISYCIADLEDAVEKKILTVQQLYHYLKDAWGPVKKGDLFDEVVNKPYDNLKKNEFEAIGIDQFFMYLRVNTIAKLVPHAAERFIENIETIYHGSFNHALLEDHEAEYKLLNIFKTVGFEHIFNHEMVENIELQGYRIITGLLDIYSPLLNMATDDFINLAKTSNHKNYPIETRLYHKLSAKHCVAYQQAIALLDKEHSSFKCWEFYYRCRLIQDYISGMTDHFAYDEYRKLMVTF